jgi:membrane associated rhomboid family serine protease
MFNLPLGNYGLLPREMSGLIGIFTSPFIHGSFQHLLSNSVPLFLLSIVILLFYRRIAIISMFLIYVLTGLTVWAFARGNVIHIGASGVIYGFVSFIFWTGLFRRNAKSIILALLVTVLYSGYFLGILPNQRGISWESHLFGALVGILVAYWMKDRIEKDEINHDPWEHDQTPPAPFFAPDTFEKNNSSYSLAVEF